MDNPTQTKALTTATNPSSSQLRDQLFDVPKPSEIVLLLAPLFQSYPAFSNGLSEIEQSALYITALEGRTRHAIKSAILDFIQGKVPKHDGQYLPPAPMVAKQALKRHDQTINNLDRAKRRERPSATPESAKTPGSTRRVKDALAAGLIGSEPWPDKAFLASLPVGTIVQPMTPQITLKTGETMSFAEYRESRKVGA